MSFRSKVVDAFTRFWRKIPRPIRSGWITAWIAFVGTILTITTSLLPHVVELITTHDYAAFSDHLSVTATLSIAAVNSFFAGCLNAVYRWLRPIADAYKLTPDDVPPVDDLDGV
jgi:hypothetical protein